MRVFLNIFLVSLSLLSNLQLLAQDTLDVEVDTAVAEENRDHGAFMKNLPADEKTEKLVKELQALKNSEAATRYLYQHAARYADFDSLYPILTGEPCPKNYTFNLLHEKLESYPAKVNLGFLALLCRNYQPLMNENGSPGLKDFSLLAEWFRQYDDELKKLKDDQLMQRDAMPFEAEIKKFEGLYCTRETVTIKKEGKPFNAYLPKGLNSFERYYNSERTSRKLLKGKHLVFYWSEGGFETETLSGTKLEDAIHAYINAQILKDVIFIELNGRFVWFDVGS